MYKHVLYTCTNIKYSYSTGCIYVSWSEKNNTDLIRHVVTDFRVQGCICMSSYKYF